MAAPAVTTTLDTHDIQGLVVRGYGALTEARFLLLEVGGRRARAQRTCGGSAAAGALASTRRRCRRSSTRSRSRSPTRGCALSACPDRYAHTFSRELVEGMDDPVRAESLGDRGRGEPSPLKWSRSRRSRAARWCTRTTRARWSTYAARSSRSSRPVRSTSCTKRPRPRSPEQKEHFGWRDGLSMPSFLGVPHERPRKKQQQSWTEPLGAGEIVLGYPNEYNAYSESPTAGLADDRGGHLARHRRRHAQGPRAQRHVPRLSRAARSTCSEFWSYLQQAQRSGRASRRQGDRSSARRWSGAGRAVRRWSVSPSTTIRAHKTDNTFTYAKDDASALRCPVGAHIRRANPRDALGAGREHEDSVTMVRKHQMVRRGRPFGLPLSKTLDPREHDRREGRLRASAAFTSSASSATSAASSSSCSATGSSPRTSAGCSRTAIRSPRGGAAATRERRVHVPRRAGSPQVQGAARVHAARRRRATSSCLASRRCGSSRGIRDGAARARACAAVRRRCGARSGRSRSSSS